MLKGTTQEKSNVQEDIISPGKQKIYSENTVDPRYLKPEQAPHFCFNYKEFELEERNPNTVQDEVSINYAA